MALRPFLLALCVLAARAQEVPLELGLHRELILVMEAETEEGTTRPLRMLLDTGAAQCLVDPAAAKGLVSRAFKSAQVGGFAGATRPALARQLRALRSGGALQRDVSVLVMSLEPVNRSLDRPVDGLLGMSFLAGRRFLLDTARGVLHWEGPELAGRSLPLVPREGDLRPWIALRVGDQDLAALLDTGAGAALVLPQGLPLVTRLPECDTVAGVDGIRTITEGRADAEAFGERRPARRAILGGAIPILGAPAFLAGPAVLDLRRQRLTLALVDGRLPPPLPEGARTLPFGWNRRGPDPFLEVDDLPRCHRWYRAGFRRGDRILAAGDLKQEALSLTALDALLRTGAQVTWTLRRRGHLVQLRNPNEDPRQEPLDLP